ncbi:hypothetical protein [Mesorhizobium sp. B2-4-17]|uniref:hypothetical protein n=1 Tax=Mesorhizobium sp. B2-4-17 TaxID=2589932 RepID=UPI0015E3332A|nr:hypothetical protein [Mesorhizobium sp. B2-4-17]
MQTLGAIVTAMAGIFFFFAIIGVFGLGTAIGALALFVVVAVGVIARTGRQQA